MFFSASVHPSHGGRYFSFSPYLTSETSHMHGTFVKKKKKGGIIYTHAFASAKGLKIKSRVEPLFFFPIHALFTRIRDFRQVINYEFTKNKNNTKKRRFSKLLSSFLLFYRLYTLVYNVSKLSSFISVVSCHTSKRFYFFELFKRSFFFFLSIY